MVSKDNQNMVFDVSYFCIDGVQLREIWLKNKIIITFFSEKLIYIKTVLK